MDQTFDTQTFQQFAEVRMNKLYSDHIVNKAWKEIISRVRRLISQEDFLNKEARVRFVQNQLQELSFSFNRDIYHIANSLIASSKNYQSIQLSEHFSSDSLEQQPGLDSHISDGPRHYATLTHSVKSKKKSSLEFPKLQKEVKKDATNKFQQERNQWNQFKKRKRNPFELKTLVPRPKLSIAIKEEHLCRNNAKIRPNRGKIQYNSQLRHISSNKNQRRGKLQHKQLKNSKKPSVTNLIAKRASNISRTSTKGLRDDQPYRSSNIEKN